jgi:hypothetical protein
LEEEVGKKECSRWRLPKRWDKLKRGKSNSGEKETELLNAKSRRY